MTELTYPIKIVPAEEGGFIVTSPMLPIFTEGETEEEALKNAEEAILCHLEGLAKDKEEEADIQIAMIHVQVPDALAA